MEGFSKQDYNTTFFEKIMRRVEESAWDSVYGGFYSSVENTNIVDSRKYLRVQTYGLLCYVWLYNITGNITYESKAYSMISILEKMKDANGY